jgi:glycine cleavage system H protein
VSDIPTDIKYSADHEWAQVSDGPDGKPVVRIGVTDYAQQALGDVVYVQLPDVGALVVAGEPLGEIESTKSVSDLFAPVTGTISARNDAVEATPELANTDPYGQGWLVEVTITDPSALDNLLDPQTYAEQVGDA